MRSILIVIFSTICFFNQSLAQIDSIKNKPKLYKSLIVPASLLTIGFISRFDVPLNKYK